MSTNLAALKNPLPVWHPKAWLFAASRLALRTVGRLSKGIRIGLEHGFDSGVMLDHVYTNKAEGFGPIGRAIDRSYLDAPGWIGIRNRGRLLTRKLSETLRQTASEDGQELVLADLACGGGQYVLDALNARAPTPMPEGLTSAWSGGMPSVTRISRNLRLATS